MYTAGNQEGFMSEWPLAVGGLLTSFFGFFMVYCCGACAISWGIGYSCNSEPLKYRIRSEKRALEDLRSNNPFNVDESTINDDDDDRDVELGERTPLLFGRS